MKTYGTISRKRSKWILELEPHAVLRAKRVFARLGRRSHGTLRLSDNVETCRDLLWFLERYPAEFIKASDREYLEKRAAEHQESEALVDTLLSGVRPPREFKLAIPAREYQRIAADMALSTRQLLLADDLGIGKTCSAICMFTDPRTLPALVVTLTHLPRQWEDEIHKFAPQLSTHVLKTRSPYDLTKARRTRPGQLELAMTRRTPDVIITSYSKLAGWAETLSGLVRTVVFDECQELRGGTKRAKKPIQKNIAAKHIAYGADFRLGTSGTPIYNYGGEFWNLFEILCPNALGTKTEFLEEWCSWSGSNDKVSIKEPKSFGAYLRDQGLMLRRTRADVGRELPSLTKIPHHIDSDMKPLDDIHSAAAELARVILAQNPQAQGEAFRASEQLNNLVRQATGIAKAPHVADFVRLLVESGEKVLLYGWHREVYSIWLERMKDFQPAMFTGSESATQKEASKQRFIQGETPVLIMSLRAGAGLDGLQSVCRTVVHGELDWSSGVHDQGDGRVHRDGQSDPVASYYLITDSGSDPIVADVLGLKRAQIQGVLNPTGDLIEKLDTGGQHVRRLAEQVLRGRSAA